MPISKEALKRASDQSRAGNLADSILTRMWNQYKVENPRPESAPAESFPPSTFTSPGPPARVSPVPGVLDAVSGFIQSEPEGSEAGVLGLGRNIARFAGGAAMSPFQAVDRIAHQMKGEGGIPFGIAQTGVELREFVKFMADQAQNVSLIIGPGDPAKSSEEKEAASARAYEEVRATGFVGPLMAWLGAKGLGKSVQKLGTLIEKGAAETSTSAKLTRDRLTGRQVEGGLTPTEAALPAQEPLSTSGSPVPLTIEPTRDPAKTGNLTHDDLVRVSENAANELNQRGLNRQLNVPVQRTPYQVTLETVNELRGARDFVISQKPKKATKRYKAKLRVATVQLQAAEAKMNIELNKQLYPFLNAVENPAPPVTPLEMRMNASAARSALNNVPAMSLGDFHPGANPLTNLGAMYSPKQHHLLRLWDRIRNRPFTYSRTSPNRLARPEVRFETSKAGRSFDNKTNRSVTWSRMVEGEAIVPVQDAIAKLDRFDRQAIRDNKFTEAYERNKPQLSEGLDNLAAVLKKSSDFLFDQTSGLLGTKRRSNWMAHQLTPAAKLAMEAKKGKLWEAIEREHPHLRGFKDSQIAPRGELPIVKSGSAEFARDANLKRSVLVNGKPVDLVNNNPLEAFSLYAHEVTRRAGIVKEFGKGTKGIQDLLDLAGDDLNLRILLKQQWMTLNGIGDAPGFHTSSWGRFSMGMESIARTAQLSLSVVPNLLGLSQSLRMFGIKNTMRAIKGAPKIEGVDPMHFSRMMQGWSKHGLDMLAGTEGLGGEFGFSKLVGDFSRKALEATGLGKVENFTNKNGGMAGLLQASDMFNDLRNIARSPAKYSQRWRRIYGGDAGSIVADIKRKYRFTEADISRIMDEGMSIADKARVLQRAPSLINQFAENPNQRPRFMRHPAFQRAMAYTSFIRLRGNMLSDAIFHAKHGNVKPLVKIMGYGILEGEAEIFLKGLLKNRERVDKNIWDRLYNDGLASASFSWFGPLFQSYEYSSGESPVGKIAQVLVPPYLEWYGQIGLDIVRAQQAKPHKRLDTIVESARRRLPIIDAAVGSGLQIFDPDEADRQKSIRRRRDLRQNRRE